MAKRQKSAAEMTEMGEAIVNRARTAASNAAAAVAAGNPLFGLAAGFPPALDPLGALASLGGFGAGAPGADATVAAAGVPLCSDPALNAAYVDAVAMYQAAAAHLAHIRRLVAETHADAAAAGAAANRVTQGVDETAGVLAALKGGGGVKPAASSLSAAAAAAAARPLGANTTITPLKTAPPGVGGTGGVSFDAWTRVAAELAPNGEATANGDAAKALVAPAKASSDAAAGPQVPGVPKPGVGVGVGVGSSAAASSPLAAADEGLRALLAVRGGLGGGAALGVGSPFGAGALGGGGSAGRASSAGSARSARSAGSAGSAGSARRRRGGRRRRVRSAEPARSRGSRRSRRCRARNN